MLPGDPLLDHRVVSLTVRQQARLRGVVLRDLFWVVVLTVPFLISASKNEPIVPRSHVSVPETASVEQPDAPAGLLRLAGDHGGSERSPWVAPECVALVGRLAAHGLPEWMATVAWRESRCQPGQVNISEKTREASYGLFQINVRGYLWAEARDRCGVRRAEALLDASTNIRCAAKLFAAYGYRPWNSGRYFES
jgi:hypothetical protein